MTTIKIAEAFAPDWVKERIARGWTVWNAPRPLLGTEHPPKTFAGGSGAIFDVPAHGVFFAAVDPADTFAPRFAEANAALDGRIVEVVPEAAAHAEFEAMCAERGTSLDEVAEYWDGDWRAAARSCGVTV